MTIDELNALTTLTATDEIPVWDSEESGEPTKKITASNLANSVKSLASLPNTTEMNDAIEQSTENLPKKIVTEVSYFNDYTYNTWIERQHVFSSMTSIENAFIGCVGGSSIQTPHEAQITDISGNTVRYIAKGMWSGGLAGITLKITAIGI